MKDWHPIKIKDFLYETFLPEEKYYKISPGKDAVMWPQCLTNGYISIGWDDMGDLTQYPDYEEFKNAFQSKGYQDTPGKNTEKANELWQFYNLKPGDRIIANKGKSQILAMGTVTSQGYEYKEELETQKHVVHVHWEPVFDSPLEISQQDYWPMKTVLELSKKQVLEWMNSKNQKKEKQIDQPSYSLKMSFSLQSWSKHWNGRDNVSYMGHREQAKRSWLEDIFNGSIIRKKF